MKCPKCDNKLVTGLQSGTYYCIADKCGFRSDRDGEIKTEESEIRKMIREEMAKLIGFPKSEGVMKAK